MYITRHVALLSVSVQLQLYVLLEECLHPLSLLLQLCLLTLNSHPQSRVLCLDIVWWEEGGENCDITVVLDPNLKYTLIDWARFSVCVRHYPNAHSNTH